MLVHGLPKGLTLNVNFPAKSEVPLKGIKVAKQANAVYREFFEERKDPYGQSYYWMDGNLENDDLNNDDGRIVGNSNFVYNEVSGSGLVYDNNNILFIIIFSFKLKGVVILFGYLYNLYNN